MKGILPFVMLGLCISSISCAKKKFTNIWVVKTLDGENFAKQVAEENGFSFHGLAISFTDHYVFKRDDLPVLSNKKRDDLTQRLKLNKKIKWVGRVKVANVVPTKEEGKYDKEEEKTEHEGTGAVHRSFRSFGSKKREEKPPPPPPKRNPALVQQPTTPIINFKPQSKGPTKNIGLSTSKDSTYIEEYPKDPYWQYQWYMQDYRTEYGPVMDHNVVAVHRMGITGEGVAVAVLDSAVDAAHPDLSGNVDESLSFNFLAHLPGFHKGQESGTRSAGVIAMRPHNSQCGVGVAYGAKIAALKVLGGPEETTEADIASALGYKGDKIDIYSSTVQMSSGGGWLLRVPQQEWESIRKGVAKGRNEKGSIYVMAAGSSKDIDDGCAFQELTNMKEVILVGAATHLGKETSYSSPCANVFITAYSDDDVGEDKVVTTLPNGKCTKSFEGTPASTHIVSGIIALALQANPELGYRDVQHLLTMSAEVAPLADNPGTWQRNGAGFWVSQDFGFGLINAQNMVELAKGWTNVGPRVTCVGDYKFEYNFHPYRATEFTSTQPHVSLLGIDACEGTDAEVGFLEHVELRVNFYYPGKRGDVFITLKSPKGTEVLMVKQRLLDNNKNGFKGWSVTSLHTWGEDPKGKWTVTIGNKHNQGAQAKSAAKETPGRRSRWGKKKKPEVHEPVTGTLLEFKLTLHGLLKPPPHMENGPRSYSAFQI